ncbi:MAG: sugar fermentation stimulation protein A [Firmicutes bacterium]|nr:sugar fermentation stimulation protein A [Bacillota bacterium]
MKYEKIVEAKFIERENRFVARVETSAGSAVETVKVHVKNTGRCRELLVAGSTGYREECAGRMGSRRLR